MENQSLEKSHSKISNFKLTIISMVLAFAANGAVIALALRGKVLDHIWAILCCIFGLLSLLSIMLFSTFKR